MRNTCSAFFLLAFFGLFSATATAADGPTAYWSFDNGFTADVGGAVYGLNAVNGALPTSANAKFGPYSAQFSSSSSQYLTTTGGSPITQGSYSYSAWYYLDVDDIADSTRYFVLENTNAAGSTYPASYGLRDLSGTDSGQVYLQNTDGDSEYYSFAAAPNKTWQNVVVTYDAATGQSKAYLNGAYAGGATLNGTPAAGTKLLIGTYRKANDRFFNGYIDDVAVWDRVLSTDEIARLQMQPAATPQVPAATQWFKGNIHAHTAWSDGKELPELAAYWYKDNGYDFLALSDHNVLMEGTKTKATSAIPSGSLDRAEALFGPGWNAIGNGNVTLKTFNEVGAKLNDPGNFLMIQGEEITGANGVHMNVLNVAQVIQPASGDNRAILNGSLAKVPQQAAAQQRPMISQINHPNYLWGLTPEDLAQVTTTRFVEVINCYGAAQHIYGDATHPGTEKMWDIANTIRIGTMKTLPLYITAADDTHEYNTIGANYANPGRGWIMVRAADLSTESLLDAMNRGDFYASTGVVLAKLDFNAVTGTLSVAVEPQDGVTYTIDFIGTLAGVDPTKQPDGTYSSEIGKVLASVTGTSASYTLAGNELYVRCVITSNQLMANPVANGPQWQQAWTQPVGGWMVVPEPSAFALLLGGSLLALSIVFLWKWKRTGNLSGEQFHE